MIRGLVFGNGVRSVVCDGIAWYSRSQLSYIRVNPVEGRDFFGLVGCARSSSLFFCSLRVCLPLLLLIGICSVDISASINDGSFLISRFVGPLVSCAATANLIMWCASSFNAIVPLHMYVGRIRLCLVGFVWGVYVRLYTSPAAALPYKFYLYVVLLCLFVNKSVARRPVIVFCLESLSLGVTNVVLAI